MDDLPVMLGILAVVLAYVSVLLFLQWSARGVSGARIARVLIELWGTFALIVALFALAVLLLGPVSGGSVSGELAARIVRVRELPSAQLALLAGMLAGAIILFAHLMWSLRAVQQEAERRSQSSDGGPL